MVTQQYWPATHLHMTHCVYPLFSVFPCFFIPDPPWSFPFLAFLYTPHNVSHIPTSCLKTSHNRFYTIPKCPFPWILFPCRQQHFQSARWSFKGTFSLADSSWDSCMGCLIIVGMVHCFPWWLWEQPGQGSPCSLRNPGYWGSSACSCFSDPHWAFVFMAISL